MTMRSKQWYTKTRKHAKSFSKVSIERERDAEIQQSRSQKSKRGPTKLGPWHVGAPRQRAHVISQRRAGQRNMAHLQRNPGEHAHEGNQAQQQAQAEVATPLNSNDVAPRVPGAGPCERQPTAEVRGFAPWLPAGG